MTGSAGHQGFAALSALMFATGLGIPVMAALNAGLGRGLQSPPAATVALFGGGLMLSAAILILAGPPPLARFASVGPGYYVGSVFVVFYILSITWAAPRIGVGNAVFFVLLGQLVAAALIDHYGLWGAVRSAITLRRAAGIAVMALGVYLARKPT